VKPKSTGLGIELGGNDSIIEQLGLTKEQLPIIGGAIGLVLLIGIGLVIFRRKNREEEYE
jgi:LPXTG-motif cell wall-anchored protein